MLYILILLYEGNLITQNSVYFHFYFIGGGIFSFLGLWTSLHLISWVVRVLFCFYKSGQVMELRLSTNANIGRGNSVRCVSSEFKESMRIFYFQGK